MTRDEKINFLRLAVAAAHAGGHIWPEYAAAEAAEESAFGESELARVANNLFGQKSGRFTRTYATIDLPTHEWIDGHLVPTTAAWPKFSSWAQAFSERMEVLRGLAGEYPHYAAALAATDGETFVREVSKTWSTDPQRADNVLSIHREFAEAFAPDQPSAAPTA